MERLVEIPDTWQWAKLAQLCQLINGDRGKNYPSKEKRSTEGFPFVNAGNLQNCGISTESMSFISKEIFDLLGSGKFGVGDILFCIRGSLGKVALNNTIDKGAIASSLVIVRPHHKIDRKYVLYYLASPLSTNMIRKFDNGTAQPNLSGADLGRFEFPVPPYPEQLRIVAKIEELFSELDKGIENLKTAREQISVYRQAVLKHAFKGKLTARWRDENKENLETADQLLDRFEHDRQERYQSQLEEWKVVLNKWQKDGARGAKPSRPARPAELPEISSVEKSSLPELPEGWTFFRLGKAIEEPQYGTSKKCDHKFDGVGVLRIPNVVMGVVDDSDLKGAEFDHDEIQTYSLKKGDILTIRSNGSVSIVGRSALISEKDEKYLYAGYLIRLRCNQEVLLPEYLIALLSSHLLRTQIESKAKSTSGVNNINSGELQSLVIPICGTGEQKQVVERLASTLSSIRVMEADIDDQLAKAAALRLAILKRALSGQLVKQDPTDEPASVLLERITAEREKPAANDVQKKTTRRKRTTAA